MLDWKLLCSQTYSIRYFFNAWSPLPHHMHGQWLLLVQLEEQHTDGGAALGLWTTSRNRRAVRAPPSTAPVLNPCFQLIEQGVHFVACIVELLFEIFVVAHPRCTLNHAASSFSAASTASRL